MKRVVIGIVMVFIVGLAGIVGVLGKSVARETTSEVQAGWGLIVSFCGFFVCVEQAPEPPLPEERTLLEDGAGRFRLGMTEPEARRVEGFELRKYDNGVIEVWDERQSSNAVLWMQLEDGKASLITVWNGYRTPEDIGYGSTVAAVEQAYGTPKSVEPIESEVCARFDRARGRSFCFGAEYATPGWKNWDEIRAAAPTVTRILVAGGPGDA